MTSQGTSGLPRAAGRLVWGADPPRPPARGGVSPYVVVPLWLILCGGLFGGAVGQMYGAQGFALGPAYVLGALQVLPLAGAPWFPLTAWRVAFAGMVLGVPGAALAGAGWAWPATSCVAYLVIVVIVAYRNERPVGTAAGLATFAAMSLPAYLALPQPPIGVVASAAVTALVVMIGSAVRTGASSGTTPETSSGATPETTSGTGRADGRGDGRGDGAPAPTGLMAVPVLGPALASVAAALWAAPYDGNGLRPRTRTGRVLLGAPAVILGGAMFGGAVAQMYGGGQAHWPLGTAYGLGALQALPLAVAPWFPLPAWRISTAGLVLGVLTYAGTGPAYPWPVTTCLAYLLILLLVGLRHDRRAVTGVAVIITAGGGALLAYQRVGLPALLFTVVFALIVLVLAANIRARRDAQAGLAAEAELRRRDLARQAVLEERSRIARELHDVVAHHMSMIAIQAEAAPYKIPGLSEEALRTFTAIRGASTTALTEMRRVIGLLRDADADAERLPQPGLEMLDDLAGGARDAGMVVRTVITGTPRPLSAGVDVSAYRIVQEALSNAGRHAPGAAVTITLAYEDRLLRIRVADDGATTGEPNDPGDGGHGLVGMRERVTMLGGTFHAGPADEGGFAVTAELPVGEDDER